MSERLEWQAGGGGALVADGALFNLFNRRGVASETKKRKGEGDAWSRLPNCCAVTLSCPPHYDTESIFLLPSLLFPREAEGKGEAEHGLLGRHVPNVVDPYAALVVVTTLLEPPPLQAQRGGSALLQVVRVNGRVCARAFISFFAPDLKNATYIEGVPLGVGRLGEAVDVEQRSFSLSSFPVQQVAKPRPPLRAGKHVWSPKAKDGESGSVRFTELFSAPCQILIDRSST